MPPSARAAANAWADKVENEIEEIKATGAKTAKGETLAKLIERRAEELEPVKRWGHSKTERT